LLQPLSLSTGVPEVLFHEKLQSRIPIDMCECSKVSKVTTVDDMCECSKVSKVTTVDRATEG
jgi:hypothetical protein